MKMRILIILFFVLAFIACKKQEYQLYSNGARVQMGDTSVLNYTFIFKPSSVTRDTVYIPINTIGGITSADRSIALIQIPEYDYTYTRNTTTGAMDTTATPKPYKAVAGIHYVGFDDPGLKSLLKIKANLAKDSVPIILLRDTSLKTNTYRLRLSLVSNNTFQLGETMSTSRTIVFSDRFERFYSWRTDDYVSPAFSNFGKYSVGKHQFMYQTLNTPIDENWYQAIAVLQAQTNYKNFLKDALVKFNADPANIASGLAPLRETSSPTSPLVFFP